MTLTTPQLDAWLAGYAQAWHTHSTDQIASLFTDDAHYVLAPFAEPLRGSAAIVDYWRHIARHQHNVRFTYSIIGIVEQRGVVHWECTLERLRKAERVSLDGVMFVTLTPAGLCSELREWWQSQSQPLTAGAGAG